jgi:hypothetical protein
MQTVAEVRRDWTPAEKRRFEDVALEYLRFSEPHMQSRDALARWLSRRHPDLVRYADLVWSYVLAN